MTATKDFSMFNLTRRQMAALNAMNFATPTPIQEQAIPVALKGKDILASAQTGTGKTGAFGIPLVAQLQANPDMTALILAPTRELASQVMDSVYQMAAGSDIKSALLIGGESMTRQLHQLQRRPRLIVGTPGRINDHLARRSLDLSHVGFLVLDETDRMLDMGFGPQLEKIMKFVPDDRQTLLFSATLPQHIIKLSARYLNDPVRIAVGSANTPAVKIQQEIVHTSDGDKYQQLLAQLEKREGSVIIFVKTKYGTERLAKRLNAASHSSDAIHGDLQQRRRERVITGFRNKNYRILVATDVAARGLDIPHIEHVINYDLPQVPEDYIHRIGRTARAGAEGSAVNLITSADSAKWKAIHKLMHGAPPAGSNQNAPSQGRGNRHKAKHRGQRQQSRQDGESQSREQQQNRRSKPKRWQRGRRNAA
ncbi:MAG: DEAD/DEAH box helicase [Bdellovibrionales bacterium]